MRPRRSRARGLGAVSALAAVLTLVVARESAAAAPGAANAPANDSANGARETDAAQQWFKHGLVAVRAGDLAAARKAFGAAYALVPSVDILWNLATTERKLGDLVAALGHLRAYVADPEARADRKKLAEEDMLPELEAATGHLLVAEPEGTIVIVDGKQIAASATLDLAPGVHSVVLRGDGRERILAVETPAGLATRLPATVPAFVQAFAVPSAFPSASTAALASPLAPAPAPASGRNVAVLGLGGAAVLALAGGVYFALAARADQETSDRLQVQLRGDDLSCRRSGTICDDFESARSASQRNSLLGTGLLVGGGVLGGAAVAAWVLWPGSVTRVTPTATRDAAGITMTGRF
jgi:hypothetical protein